MTITSPKRREAHVLDGISTSFAVPFRFLTAADLQVLMTTPAGDEHLLTLNVDYTVVNNGPGGTLTYPAAGPAGGTLTIRRVVPRTQETDYVENDRFHAESHEAALDKLTMIAQEDGDDLTRALLLPDTDPLRGQMQLPPMPGRAGKAFVFDAAGRPSTATLNDGDGDLRADLAGAGGSALIGHDNQTVGDLLTGIRGSGPVVIVVAGQSNAVGARNDGPNPYNPLVKSWDHGAGGWVSGGQYTSLPWTQAAPAGNGGNNNFGLGAAHRIAEVTGRPVYVVYDARSGRPISDWVPANAPRYVALRAKVGAALASPELAGAGKGDIDLLIWAHGEENGAGDNGLYTGEYIAEMVKLDKQLRGDPADPATYPGESWMTVSTPAYAMGMSPLHDRYQISPALQAFCGKVNGRWKYISTRALRTEYQEFATGDFTHWTGESLWRGGYELIAAPWLAGLHTGNETTGPMFWNRADGSATGEDKTVITSFGTLASWDSRTGGLLHERFSGTGAKTDFLLDYRDTTIARVLVGGVAQEDPTDYSVATDAVTRRRTISFVSAPAAGTDNVVVEYSAAVSTAATIGSVAWGYACYPDGNYSFAGGYVTGTDNLARYSFGWGRDIWMAAGADYSAGFGFQTLILAAYGFAAGRGAIVADEGGSSLGLFPAYVTPEADPVLFQVGNGASAAARSTAFAVRESGVIEAGGLPEYADNSAATTGGLLVGQLYRTSGGEVRVVV